MAEASDVFADEDGIGRITCPGCENHLSAILAAFREGQPCPECGMPVEVVRQVFEFRRKGADEALGRKYLDAEKRAVAAEEELRVLHSRMREIREVANRPWMPA